ncbi:ATPase, T2SS/T4P/T4SS family [Pseudoxanthomonas kaohsiungensis]|uniref:ATPase, T2SS/T4P/T4SS family n=1 Tax=Pseudoxanthomonas kaohsiungensis TaxID=283923 RepID=A0ABW3LZL8_9GAMM|nr:ATPase, T2SS/T4P/T4SS family [Pseudoxanthomonas kaohsiungensis]KAF1702979.1 twitching motility protein PilT [Pseudoxanthomonas kaohsiungensis]
MIAPELAELAFVDLYLGARYADYSPLAGAFAPRMDLPEGLREAAERLRAACQEAHEHAGDSRFTIELAGPGTLCRVQVMHDLRAEPVFVLRRIASEIRPFDRLGLPSYVIQFLMQSSTRGLIIFVGEQGTGKTTSAASLLSARLHALGGRALAVEDPPETMLDGLHGPGRCLQVPVSKRHGSYSEQIHNGMRSGVSTLLIGEVRSAETAREAVTQSINGMTVITTIHGTDPSDGLRRLVTWAEATQDGLSNAADLLASGLAGVVHQRIERIGQPDGPQKAKAMFKSLLVPPPDDQAGAGIRSKVRNGDMDGLKEDIEQQVRRQQWK